MPAAFPQSQAFLFIWRNPHLLQSTYKGQPNIKKKIKIGLARHQKWCQLKSSAIYLYTLPEEVRSWGALGPYLGSKWAMHLLYLCPGGLGSFLFLCPAGHMSDPWHLNKYEQASKHRTRKVGTLQILAQHTLVFVISKSISPFPKIGSSWRSSPQTIQVFGRVQLPWFGSDTEHLLGLGHRC